MPSRPAPQGILSAAAWKLLGYAPLPAVTALDRLHHTATIIANLRMPVMRFTGTHPVTGRSTTVVVANNAPSVEYFTRHLLGRDFDSVSIGHAAVWNLPRLCTGVYRDATLFVACIDRRLGRLIFRNDCLHVPECIGVNLTVPQDGDVTRRARHSNRNNIRAIHRNHLSWETGHSLEDFDHFYHRMYVPYALARHGDGAMIRSHARLRIHMRHGGILWVLHDGRRVSGSLFTVAGDTLYLICRGTGLQREETVYRGAINSSYVFGVQYAKQAGLHRLDLGVCRPSLRDGVLVYKKRWGAALHESPRCRHSLVFHWANWNSEIAHFIRQTAPITRDRNGLGAIAAAAEGSMDAGELEKELLAPGIRHLRILDGAVMPSVSDRASA
jgi:hypothetical protein